MTCGVEEFYTKNAGLLKFTIKTIQYLPALEKLWRLNFDFKPGIKILDVGCGNGALTKTLLKTSRNLKVEPVNFFALDVTEALLNEFRLWILQQEITNIRTIKADLRETARLPFSWRNFDVICSSGVLEYLEEQEIIDALRHFYELLKPEGRLIAMDSHKHVFNYFLIHLLYRANLYSRKKFVRMVRSVGFEKISFWRFPYPYSYLNFWGYIVVAEK